MLISTSGLLQSMEPGFRECSLRTDYTHTFKLLSTGKDREVSYIFLLSSPQPPNHLLPHIFLLKIALHLSHYLSNFFFKNMFSGFPFGKKNHQLSSHVCFPCVPITSFTVAKYAPKDTPKNLSGKDCLTDLR